MKKLLLLVCLLFIAAQTPPALPSSFYGWITPNQSANTQVSAWVNGAKVASVPVQFYQGATVYGGLDVPCVENEVITFKIGGKVGGSGICHQGTYVQMDLNTGRVSKKRR